MSGFGKFGFLNALTNLKETKIKVGKLEIPLMFIVVGVVAVVGGAYAYLSTRTPASEEGAPGTQTVATAPDGTMANPYALAPLSQEQLLGNSYYIKDGNAYYALAPGMLYSTKEDDTPIPEQASPTERILMFGMDDTTIPTLYSDSQIIYKTDGAMAIPTDFYLERFRDEGYTIGIRGLTPKNGKYSVTVDAATFYPGSSISTLPIELGGELTVDRVNGMPLTEETISAGGTITGLTKGTAYQFDIYGGTNFNGVNAEADTHMFTSYELFDIKDYKMDQNNYLSISMPKDMWSGYYYINGMGCFRYVNLPKAEAGSATVSYNVHYFLGHADGMQLINPADTGRPDAVYIGDDFSLDELKQSGKYYGYPLEEDSSTDDTDKGPLSDAPDRESDVPTNEELADGQRVSEDPDTQTIVRGSEFASLLTPNIKIVIFVNTKVPTGAQVTDISVSQDGSVQAWSDTDTLYVTSLNGKPILANPDSTGMFEGSSVQALDFGNLDESHITNMAGMFKDCTQLGLISGLDDTKNVQTMDEAFSGCTALQDYSFADNWDIHNVTSAKEVCAGSPARPAWEKKGSWDDDGTFHVAQSEREFNGLGLTEGTTIAPEEDPGQAPPTAEQEQITEELSEQAATETGTVPAAQ